MGGQERVKSMKQDYELSSEAMQVAITILSETAKRCKLGNNYLSTVKQVTEEVMIASGVPEGTVSIICEYMRQIYTGGK